MTIFNSYVKLPEGNIYIYIYIWLVVWNIFYFSIYGNVIIPTDELIFFRGVGFNHQQKWKWDHGTVVNFHMEDMEAAYFTYFYIWDLGTEAPGLNGSMLNFRVTKN